MLAILIQNDGTGNEVDAAYDWRVMVNDQVIERGRVERHDRREGWRELARKVLDEADRAELRRFGQLMDEHESKRGKKPTIDF